MKNLLKFSLLGALFLSFFAACDSDDDTTTTPDPEVPAETNIVVTENITSDVTWEASNTYELASRITVEAGATLNIEPGTVIKGQAAGANATALLVARGGTLNANGRAALPIIFTSVADEIENADIAAGNFGSPNLPADINGLWGGVIILGNAPISASVGAVQTSVKVTRSTA